MTRIYLDNVSLSSFEDLVGLLRKGQTIKLPRPREVLSFLFLNKAGEGDWLANMRCLSHRQEFWFHFLSGRLAESDELELFLSKPSLFSYHKYRQITACSIIVFLQA